MYLHFDITLARVCIYISTLTLARVCNNTLTLRLARVCIYISGRTDHKHIYTLSWVRTPWLQKHMHTQKTNFLRILLRDFLHGLNVKESCH